ncbi:autophagy protein 16, interacts with Atg12p-Atg5p [Penicillium ochrochloron]
MPHWREEYLAALAVRDQREKANVALYDAYTRLADRTTQLQTPIDSEVSPAAGRRSSIAPNESQQSGSPSPGTVPKRQPSSESGPSLTDLLKTTRADLSEAQRSRTDLQDQLSRLNIEAEKLRKKSNRDGRRLETLESEKAILGKRLKDRDEELREKSKLLEDFQAELASLNLEFNMAEKKSKELQRENKELVDRWMARMGKEADAMNDASKFS